VVEHDAVNEPRTEVAEARSPTTPRAERSTGDPGLDPEASTGDPGLDPETSTGDARVDFAVARLDELDSRPTDEHVQVFDDVHRRLQDALDGDEGE
jgi:hypothetical protein